MLHHESSPCMGSYIASYINETPNENAKVNPFNSILLHLYRSTTMDQLLLLCEPYLTSNQPTERARCCTLLGEILLRLPQLSISSSTCISLCVFFVERLNDSLSIQPCLKGLHALIQYHTINLVTKEVPFRPVLEQLFSVIQTKVDIAAMGQLIRHAAYEIYQLFVTNAVFADFLYHSQLESRCLTTFLIASFGEKDPRNLLLCFNILAEMLKKFPQKMLMEVKEEREQKEENEGKEKEKKEERRVCFLQRIFERVCCYFPISFVPPSNDPYKITVDQLKRSLLDVFLVNPAMDRYLINYLLETIQQVASVETKLECIDMLVQCLSGYTFDEEKYVVYINTLTSVFFDEMMEKNDKKVNQAIAEATTNITMILSEKTTILWHRWIDQMVLKCMNMLRNQSLDTMNSLYSCNLLEAISQANIQSLKSIYQRIFPFLMEKFHSTKESHEIEAILKSILKMISALCAEIHYSDETVQFLRVYFVPIYETVTFFLSTINDVNGKLYPTQKEKEAATEENHEGEHHEDEKKRKIDSGDRSKKQMEVTGTLVGAVATTTPTTTKIKKDCFLPVHHHSVTTECIALEVLCCLITRPSSSVLNEKATCDLCNLLTNYILSYEIVEVREKALECLRKIIAKSICQGDSSENVYLSPIVHETVPRVIKQALDVFRVVTEMRNIVLKETEPKDLSGLCMKTQPNQSLPLQTLLRDLSILCSNCFPIFVVCTTSLLQLLEEAWTCDEWKMKTKEKEKEKNFDLREQSCVMVLQTIAQMIFSNRNRQSMDYLIFPDKEKEKLQQFGVGVEIPLTSFVNLLLTELFHTCTVYMNPKLSTRLVGLGNRINPLISTFHYISQSCSLEGQIVLVKSIWEKFYFRQNLTNPTDQIFRADASIQQQKLVGVLAAVLVNAHPLVLTKVFDQQCISCLFDLALCYTAYEGRFYCSKILSSFINKICLESSVFYYLLEEVEDHLTSVLTKGTVSIPVIELYLWLAKGLLLRGHDKGYEYLTVLCKFLKRSEEFHTIEGTDLALAIGRGFRFFSIEQKDVFTHECHAIVDPLFHQKLCTSTFNSLLHVPLHFPPSNNNERGVIHALIYVFQNAPLPVVQPYLTSLLYVVIKSLSEKDVGPSLASDALTSFALLMKRKSTQEQIIPYMKDVVAGLLCLGERAVKCQRRLLALECIDHLRELPYMELHPYKEEVIRTLGKILDDPIRTVRNKAVLVRNEWTIL